MTGPNQSGFGDPGNNPHAEKVVEAINRFLDHLLTRGPSAHVERVVNASKRLDGSKIGQAPERFIEEHFVRYVAEEVLRYDYRPQPKGVAGLNQKIPDFQVVNAEVTVIGELKKPNSIGNARVESVKYLDEVDERPAAGIATDGWTWVLHRSDHPDESPSYERHVSLRPVIKQVRRDRSYEQKEPTRRRDLREQCHEFVDQFHLSELDS